jgi:hypothetical protein
MSFFPNKELAKIWNTTKEKSPAQILELIPAQYSETKENVKNSIETYNNTINTLNAIESSIPVISTDNSSFNALLNDVSELRQYEQYLFDNMVYQMYIKGQRSNNNTFFSDWYLLKTREQYEGVLIKLQSKFSDLIDLINKEIEIKNKLQEYQIFVNTIQKQWSQILNEHISEQIKILNKIQGINFTKRRQSEFDINKVQMLQNISYWVTLIFFIILISFLFFFVKNNQDYIYEKFRSFKKNSD